MDMNSIFGQIWAAGRYFTSRQPPLSCCFGNRSSPVYDRFQSVSWQKNGTFQTKGSGFREYCGTAFFSSSWWKGISRKVQAHVLGMSGRAVPPAQGSGGNYGARECCQKWQHGCLLGWPRLCRDLAVRENAYALGHAGVSVNSWTKPMTE